MKSPGFDSYNLPYEKTAIVADGRLRRLCLPAILPSGLAGQFLSLLIQSHYVLFIGAVQLVGGALLLAKGYVPLALTLLGPVIVNVLLYHLLLSHAGAGLAILVMILWVFLFFRYRHL